MTDLSQTLESYAERAGDVRADMLEVVESRYRKRRRAQAISSAAGVLIVAAIVTAAFVINPFTGTTPKPITPATWTQQGPWRIPKPSAPVPSPAAVWPEAVVHLPAVTPGGQKPAAVAAIDSTHLVVADDLGQGISTFYSYDTVEATFKVIAKPADRRQVQWVITSPHWLAWSVEDASHRLAVYKAPLAGGAVQLIATVAFPTVPTSWYATDDALYYSDSKPGVIRLPMAGGKVSALAGFADFYVDGSPWAHAWPRAATDTLDPGGLLTSSGTVMASLKNIITGAQRTIASKPDDVGLGCMPEFCVGETDGESFVRKVDGTSSVPLPPSLSSDPSSRVEFVPIGGQRSLFSTWTIPDSANPDQTDWDYLWDPQSGKIAKFDAAGIPIQAGLLSLPDGKTVIILSRIH
jgi:hypothetical protein